MNWDKIGKVVLGIVGLVTFVVGVRQFHDNAQFNYQKAERDLALSVFENYESLLEKESSIESADRSLLRALDNVIQYRWALALDKLSGHSHRVSEALLDEKPEALVSFEETNDRKEHRRYRAFKRYSEGQARKHLSLVISGLKDGDKNPVRAELTVAASTFLSDCDSLNRLYALNIGFNTGEANWCKQKRRAP